MTGSNVLIASESVLGNGVVDSLTDIVFVKLGSFDAKYTFEIAKEIETINKKIVNEKRQYLLIGFGRWGTTDSWAGIPVDWSQISGAKVIVEATMENMIQEMSQASHFFIMYQVFRCFIFLSLLRNPIAIL